MTVNWRSHAVIRLLGSNTDLAVSAELGVCEWMVRHHRSRLRIGAYGNGINHAAIRPDLGKMTDREVAQRHGCSQTTVGIQRRKLGIRSFDPRGRKNHMHRDTP